MSRLFSTGNANSFNQQAMIESESEEDFDVPTFFENEPKTQELTGLAKCAMISNKEVPFFILSGKTLAPRCWLCAVNGEDIALEQGVYEEDKKARPNTKASFICQRLDSKGKRMHGNFRLKPEVLRAIYDHHCPKVAGTDGKLVKEFLRKLKGLPLFCRKCHACTLGVSEKDDSKQWFGHFFIMCDCPNGEKDKLLHCISQNKIGFTEVEPVLASFAKQFLAYPRCSPTIRPAKELSSDFIFE